MDLKAFMILVDKTPTQIGLLGGDLTALYTYVGLESKGSYHLSAVTDILYAKIREAFTSGLGTARQACRTFLTDLIREHVVLDTQLDPYFEVLSCLCDAFRDSGQDQGEIIGDWTTAVKAARDYVALIPGHSSNRENIYAREFAVAKAARALKDIGYAIRLESGWISLEECAEIALVQEIERLTAKIGGLNLSRRLFSTISPDYDSNLQRYHLIPRISITGAECRKFLGVTCFN